MKRVEIFPYFEKKPWSGEKLKSIFNLDENVGEAWIVSCIGEKESHLEDGTKLSDFIKDHHEEFGLEKDEEFPILVKLIDAKENLSIQLHPDDEYAKLVGTGKGKYECWKVLDENESNQVIVGLQTDNIDEIFSSIIGGDFERVVNYMPIKSGDLIKIKPGTVHAILANSFFLEAQDPSDTTYRIYDYNRLPRRELHIEDSLEMIKKGTSFGDFDRYYIGEDDEKYIIKKKGFAGFFIEVFKKTYKTFVVYDIEIDKDTLDKYNKWINSDAVSKEDKEILKAMNSDEIDDAFFKDIEFGTGGLRGLMGPGTNRVNEHIVKKLTVGIGKYLNDKVVGKKAKVAISYDNRNRSKEFAFLASDILNKMGVDTYIFDYMHPTPELSFAVRYSRCNLGIMITASHNPKEYNGYKVYDELGTQLVPYQVDELLKYINLIKDELKTDVKDALIKGERHIYSNQIDHDYIQEVLSIQLNPFQENKDKFKIVYTSNQGASYDNAMSAFKACGYNVTPVSEQCYGDSNFENVINPNPETKEAFIKPIEVAKSIDADLITMTDPDGDRVGLGIKLNNGLYYLMSGNETGALLFDYICSNLESNCKMPNNPLMINTIVTSHFGKKIAEKYGVEVESFLTGFKYIGERIGYYEKLGNPKNFIFGYEESCGCLIKPFVRDKDGVQAILMYAEMALYYKNKGLNLKEAYDELCLKYGCYYKSKLCNFAFKGSEGLLKMNKLIERIRKKPFKKINKYNVKFVEDYKLQQKINLETEEITKLDTLPISNVLKFIFEDDSNIEIRPSGTEPKCKIYIEVSAKDELTASKKLESFYNFVIKKYNLN